MKILITGANGFLGMHVVNQLKNNHSVSCLVRSKQPIQGTETHFFQSYTDPIIENLIQKADVIIHIASQLHGQWDDMFLANVTFTKHLVALANKSAIKHFIYISSENVSQSNTDIYSKTKELAEREVEQFSSHLILRPTIIYGANDTKYVGRLASIIRKFPLVPVLGNGKSKFQFVYVGDLVQVIENGMNSFITGTYTIAGVESITYNEFMRNLMEAMNVKKVMFHLPMFLLKPFSHILNFLFKNPPLTPTQLDNLLKDRVYDISKVVAKFHYKPTLLKEGLKITLG